jgi:hypothetical protein
MSGLREGAAQYQVGSAGPELVIPGRRSAFRPAVPSRTKRAKPLSRFASKRRADRQMAKAIAIARRGIISAIKASGSLGRLG